HAFNELASFGAAWTQMLNYIITIAISAYFVPHYLSIFWPPLKTTPWDAIGGIVVIAILVGLNILGAQEAARLSIVLAVIDFATQLMLVLLGAVLVLHPHVLANNVQFGVAPTWGQFFLAIPIAMIAYTGIETVSNLAEEARDPPRDIPRSITWVAIAVFAIYFTLPSIALSALPVHLVDGKWVTALGQGPEQGGFKNDPVLGLVDNMGLHGIALSIARYYVGVLAATILFVATNAGVIGASRITYAMASYQQLPERFRRLHRKFKTPWLSLAVFAAVAPAIVLLPGIFGDSSSEVDFLGNIYAFGAMLSFSVAHLSVIALRRKHRDEELIFRARPNLRYRGVDWPLFAIFGALATLGAWAVVVIQHSAVRWTGLGWLAFGFVLYAVYRRRVLRVPLTETVRAPIVITPGAALEYRNILVPMAPGPSSKEAIDVACRLASERRALVVAMVVLEVPLEYPLDARVPELEEHANNLLDEAQAVGDSYGVRVVPRLTRARSAASAIVEEAKSRGSEIVVMGTPRKERLRVRGAALGETVDFVLRNAPCRVMVVAARKAVA
ncbi:MAG: basic amino acid/polyamine antiporter, family, partial [Gaiellaceae bacterium]|nr:basic amino acid/polyamine antiporter, family [Gaiellaceae bacterium]